MLKRSSNLSAIGRAILLLGGLAAAPLPAMAATAADAAEATGFADPGAGPGPAQQTVVVTATRHAMALVDAPASISVISRAQIAEQGADNLFEALRGETGVALIGRTISGRRNLSQRGMDGRHTLFLVDGKRIAASDGVVGHSDFQYDWVAAEQIQRIEVIRGPMSVLYGGEALGGVVNVITRAPGDHWAGRLLAEGSLANGGRGGDGQRAALAVEGPLADHWRLAASLAQTRRQAIHSAAETRIDDIEGRSKQDGALRLLWLPAAGQRVDLDQRNGLEERWAGVRERSGPRRFHQSMHHIGRWHSALGWTADWGGAWQASSQLRAYASHIEVNNHRTAGVSALRPQTLDERVVEGQATLQPAAGRQISAGFEARRERLRNEGLPGGQGGTTHQALFAQAELALLPALSLTLGARWDGHQRFGAEWSPRAYAVWQPAPGWVIKGGAGHGWKAPTLKQITPGYREDEGPNTFFGNADLRPESNDALELGAGWDAAALGAQALLFHNRVQNLIVPRLINSVAGRGQYVFENLDQARLQGLELEAHARLPAGWKVSANATWLDARDGQRQRLEKRPRQVLGLQLDWASGPWRAGLRLQHQAGQLIATPTVGQPLQPLPNLTRASAQISRRLQPGLDLSLGVDNLGGLQLAEKSALFTWAEAPRTWRLALRSAW